MLTTTLPRALALGFAVLAAAAADDWGSRLRALRPADVSAQENAVLDSVERLARDSLASLSHPRDSAEARQEAPRLRKRLAQSLGFLQFPWPPYLGEKVVGAVRRKGYRIEKVVYEGLPGVRVPAHVYVPEHARGRAPAIIFYTGHWWTDSKTRPDFQAFSINMARLGFVVLIFDAFGQGERGVSWRDHRRTGALLVGVSQQGFAVYETQCAFQYLLTRRDVDPGRVGITGASGGGYNTWITSALEEWVPVAVPVVGTSEFYEQIQVTRALDWYRASEHCHFVPGLIHYANNHELAAMIAPRPLLIIAASEDQSFPIAGVREVAGYAARLYESFGARDRFGFFEDSSSGHGYQQKKREAAYGWFLKWLKGEGDGGPHPELPTETEPPDSVELRCFPPGQNQAAGPGMMETVRRLARELPPRDPRPRMEDVFCSPPELPRVRVEFASRPLQRILIPSEPDLDVPAFLARPAGSPKGLLLAADDRGKEALGGEPLFARALQAGWAVCGVDPRGIGEMATSKMGWVSAVSLLVGEHYVKRQGRDLRQAARLVGGAKEFASKPVVLYARGHNTALAAIYALAQEVMGNRVRVAKYALRDGFLSYRQFIERPKSLELSFRLQPGPEERFSVYDREIPFHYFPFQALHSFDLPQLLARAPASGLIVNPIDGDWDRMAAEEARKLAPAGVQVISADEPDDRLAEFLVVPDGR